MEILKYDEYSKLNEEVSVNSFSEVEINKAWATYGEMKKNFIGRHYTFLGTIYSEIKTVNAYKNDYFDSVITERIKSVWNGNIHDETSISVEPNDGIGYDYFGEIISKSVDEVTSCRTKTGKTYYVIFNRTKKYFYFIYIKYVTPRLDLWLRIKTKGEDVVYNELLKEKEEREERQREREKKEAELRKEKEEKDRIHTEYEKQVEILKSDVEENPENYKRVKFDELPDEMKDAFRNKIEGSGFIEYRVDKHIFDPYQKFTYDVYMNNVSLSDGYVFEIIVDKGRKDGYVGD